MMNTNKKIYVLLLFSMIIFQQCTTVNDPVYEIFVSSNNGASQNKGTVDAPFLTIQEAIDRARQIRQQNDKDKITITMLSGTYHLSAPIHITNQLSGLVIKASTPSEVVIKGSVPLDLTWKKEDTNIYVSNIKKDLNFDQLVVDDQLQIVARYPNYAEDGSQWQGHAEDAISKERIQSWKNPIGTIFHAMHKGRWGGFHYTITGIDSTGNAILEGGYQNNRPSPPHKKYRMVENVLEELDSPGEWFLDKKNKKIYYWPPSHVDITKASFEGVILKNLITIAGDENTPVRNVLIEGIKFEHTKRTFTETYEPLLRSDWSIYRGGALYLEGTENCSIKNCEFTNLGGNVVFASSYNRDLTISENHIHDCGASAICFVGDASAVRSPSFQYGQYVPFTEMDTIPGPKNNLYPKDCIAENNLIYRIGRVEKQTAGVQIAMAMNIKVSHNSIYEVPRAGINIGDGTWGGHTVEFNDVFDTVLETGDHGSFNSWGRDRFWHPKRGIMDSIMLENPEMAKWDAIHTTTIHDNRFRCDHGWDIDLDDGSSNYHIYNNVCLNGGLKLREGFYRVVENNIMINNGFHPHVWFKNSEDIFRNNIVTQKHKDIRLKGWGKEVDHNYFLTEEDLRLANEMGVDSTSTYGDPLFENPLTMNYRVLEHSGALKQGFKNFSMNTFGVQVPALKKIAKTPEIPLFNVSERLKAKKEGTLSNVTWLGANIKNIETMEEASASGLEEIAGVMILKMSSDSRLKKGGLEAEDVIIAVDKKKIETKEALMKIDTTAGKANTLKITVRRDQKEKTVFVPGMAWNE